MAKCPTCGRTFTPCQSVTSALNWRRIACSYDCAQKYIERVEEQRRKDRIEQSRAKYLEAKIKEDVGIDAFRANA